MSFSSAAKASYCGLKDAAGEINGPVKHRDALAGFRVLFFASWQLSRIVERFADKLARNLGTPDLPAGTREHVLSTCDCARKATATQRQAVRDLEQLVSAYEDAVHSPCLDADWRIDRQGA